MFRLPSNPSTQQSRSTTSSQFSVEPSLRSPPNLRKGTAPGERAGKVCRLVQGGNSPRPFCRLAFSRPISLPFPTYSDRGAGKGWKDILAMGSKILPFVGKQGEITRACIRCVPLYDRKRPYSCSFLTAFPSDDALQTDPDKKVSETEPDYGHLLQHAARTITLYAAHVKTFQALVAELKAHQLRNSWSSRFHDYINHDSFDVLVIMGEGQRVSIGDGRVCRGPGWMVA
jgi:hypothetical protein